MKKVAFIYGGSSERGGLSTYYRLLFKNYSKDKFDFRFASLGKWATSQTIKDGGGNVYEIENHRFSPISLIKITKYIKKEDINLIVTAGLISNFYGRLVALRTGVPVLTTIHSNYIFDYPGLLKRIFYYISDKSLRFKTDHYVAVSEYLKGEIISSGVREKMVSVVYNGVEFGDIDKKRHKGIVIGSIGRLHKTKGFDILIRAMMNLSENVTLKIWGEGQERKDLERIIEDNNLSKRVKLEGFSEDISKALSEIDIYVQPSRMEGFGLSVVEAMGAGVPVVVSSNGALPELVEDSKTGLVSKLSEDELLAKIKIMIGDEKNRELLGNNARKEVRTRFGIEKWVSNLESVIGMVAK